MTKRADLGTKELYEDAIRQNISKKDLPKLIDTMAEAEKAGVGKTLRRKGWFALGRLEAERGNHPAAIVALNSARLLDAHPEVTLDRIFDELDAFCQDFVGRFSRQDLSLLSMAIGRIGSFHSYHSKATAGILDRLDEIHHWIEDQLRTAEEKEESPASHHVQRIYAALYPPMNAEEVRAEFARLVEPLFRESLQREAQPAAGGGGQGPNDPDEPEDKPISPPRKQPKSKKKKRKNRKK